MGLRGRTSGGHPRGRFCSTECADTVRRVDDPVYRSRHTRVSRARGKASDQTCVDCGNPATDWSQRHGTMGNDPQDYSARCKKCHAAYDSESLRRGEDAPWSKLTEGAVREIRAHPGVSSAEYARKFGVSRQAVAHVRARRTWKHL